MNSKVLILINEKAKRSEPWNSTRGIYADFSKGFDKPEYYNKCPNCRYVHGTYKTPKEAILKRLCPLCASRDIEKMKKEIRMVEALVENLLNPNDRLLESDDLKDFARSVKHGNLAITSVVQDAYNQVLALSYENMSEFDTQARRITDDMVVRLEELLHRRALDGLKEMLYASAPKPWNYEPGHKISRKYAREIVVSFRGGSQKIK